MIYTDVLFIFDTKSSEKYELLAQRDSTAADLLLPLVVRRVYLMF